MSAHRLKSARKFLNKDLQFQDKEYIFIKELITLNTDKFIDQIIKSNRYSKIKASTSKLNFFNDIRRVVAEDYSINDKSILSKLTVQTDGINDIVDNYIKEYMCKETILNFIEDFFKLKNFKSVNSRYKVIQTLFKYVFNYINKDYWIDNKADIFLNLEEYSCIIATETIVCKDNRLTYITDFITNIIKQPELSKMIFKARINTQNYLKDYYNDDDWVDKNLLPMSNYIYDEIREYSKEQNMPKLLAIILSITTLLINEQLLNTDITKVCNIDENSGKIQFKNINDIEPIIKDFSIIQVMFETFLTNYHKEKGSFKPKTTNTPPSFIMNRKINTPINKRDFVPIIYDKEDLNLDLVYFSSRRYVNRDLKSGFLMALYNNWIPDKNDKLYKILFPKGEKSINEYKNCYPLQTIINHYNFNNPISIEENQDKDLLSLFLE